jgi:hypothetical protein
MVQVLLEQLVDAELVKTYPAFIESKISYSYYTQSNAGSHPEPVGFRPQFYSPFIEATFQYRAWGSVATSRKFPGSIPGRVTGDFFRGIRQVHVPGVDSAFRNEYQDIPGGKAGRCVRLTTLPP